MHNGYGSSPNSSHEAPQLPSATLFGIGQFASAYKVQQPASRHHVTADWLNKCGAASTQCAAVRQLANGTQPQSGSA